MSSGFRPSVMPSPKGSADMCSPLTCLAASPGSHMQWVGRGAGRRHIQGAPHRKTPTPSGLMSSYCVLAPTRPRGQGRVQETHPERGVTLFVEELLPESPQAPAHSPTRHGHLTAPRHPYCPVMAPSGRTGQRQCWVSTAARTLIPWSGTDLFPCALPKYLLPRSVPGPGSRHTLRTA